MDREEHNLVESALKGDTSAQEQIVERYARLVGTVIWRATRDATTVEDLAQETFIKVFRALDTFDRNARLSTWIYTIAHRTAIDHLRKTGRWHTVPLEGEDDDDSDRLGHLAATGTADPETAYFRAEASRRVHEALGQLPEKYRVPLVYASIEGLDYATIADMMEIPLATVKTLVFRAKKLLRKRILSAMESGPDEERSREL